jgi:hypothetical protein
MNACPVWNAKTRNIGTNKLTLKLSMLMLVSDFESSVPPAQRQLCLIYRRDVSGSGAAFELLAELRNRFGGPLCNRFHIPVRQIADGANHAHMAGGAGDEVAKTHALYPSRYYESPCDHT